MLRPAPAQSHAEQVMRLEHSVRAETLELQPLRFLESHAA